MPKEIKSPKHRVDGRALQHKKIFTTGEAARLLQVSQMSVIKWFNEGKLEGYRVPYSRDRRISRESIISFIKENNIPIDDFVNLTRSILVVDDDSAIRNTVKLAYEDNESFAVYDASTGYEAGLMMGRYEPDVVVLDIMLGDMDSRDLVKRIREDAAFSHAKVLGVSAYFRSADAEALKKLGFDDFLPKPFTVDELCAKISSLLE